MHRLLFSLDRAIVVCSERPADAIDSGVARRDSQIPQHAGEPIQRFTLDGRDVSISPAHRPAREP
jgi:hypothetical protein